MSLSNIVNSLWAVLLLREVSRAIPPFVRVLLQLSFLAHLDCIQPGGLLFCLPMTSFVPLFACLYGWPPFLSRACNLCLQLSAAGMPT